MYEFIDVFENSEGMSLPSEALKINGKYIEEEIEGYRTLSVEGREALSPELTTFETGIRDGSCLKGKRYPARTLKITYQLSAKTNEEFRAAYNKLASILNVTDAELIFNDETDKFYTGTPSRIGEVPPGKNIVIGEFDILCLDPFKYSVMEYEVVPDTGTNYAVLNYNGTYKSFPTLRADFYKENEASEDGETVNGLTGNGDCGYVAFFNEDEKIIQIGNPDEADGEDAYQKSQTLINQRFDNANGWGNAAKSQWSVNAAREDLIGVKQIGSLKTGVASYTNPALKSSNEVTILTATSTANKPVIHYEITATFSERTATSVKVTVGIHTRLDQYESYFGKGYTLKAKFIMSGVEKDIVLKDSQTVWSTNVKRAKYITFTFDGINSYERSFPSTFEAYRNDGTGGTAGTLARTDCKNFNVPEYHNYPETYFLCPDSYGSANSGCNGASITRVIPADASGVSGAVNCQLSYSQKLCAGASKGYSEHGSFSAYMINTSEIGIKRIVAGVTVNKIANGAKAVLSFFVNGAVKDTVQVDVSPKSSRFNSDRQSVITKTGQTVTFNICHTERTFKSANIADLAVTEITFAMASYGKSLPLEYNGLYWVKFVKNNCDTWRDIPNKFSANDVVEADCKNGEIYLNGNSAQAYGALGNDWEGFYLTPGANQIGFSYSEWVEAAYAPTFKVKYREVFL